MSNNVSLLRWRHLWLYCQSKNTVSNLEGAVSKEEEVVDELLVLRHAKFLLRESGFPLEVPFLLFCVAAALRHQLC